MAKKRSYYDILQVREDAEQEVISMAYKALCRKYHPDTHEDEEFATRKMQEINEAYAVLGNESSRLRYDRENGFNQEDINDYEETYDDDDEYDDDETVGLDDEEFDEDEVKEYANMCYEIVKDTAESSALIQSISGLIGFPFTLAADVLTITNKLLPMVRSIRRVYGRPSISKDQLSNVISSLSDELLSDLVLDKLAGNIPFVGIYFNNVCSKALAWRVGMLFSIISAHTSEINRRELDLVVKLINSVFPQSSALSFRTVTDVQFKMCCSICTVPSDLMFTFWVKVITAFFAEEESYEVGDAKYFVVEKTKINGKRYMLVVNDDFHVELWQYKEDEDGLSYREVDMTDDIMEKIINK